MTKAFKPAKENIQCPNCHFSGEKGLFEPDWQMHLINLAYKHHEQGINESDLQSMTIQIQHGVYQYLKKLSFDDKD